MQCIATERHYCFLSGLSHFVKKFLLINFYLPFHLSRSLTFALYLGIFPPHTLSICIYPCFSLTDSICIICCRHNRYSCFTWPYLFNCLRGSMARSDVNYCACTHEAYNDITEIFLEIEHLSKCLSLPLQYHQTNSS